jgi:hypothetical protein
MSDQSTPTPAQPEGQGGEEANGTGLYDLASAPEEYRPFLEAELKKMEGNATRKFQEAAEFRKQWEPYAELNLQDVPPEELQGLLQLRELANDEQAFDAWLTDVAKARGILDGEPAEEEDDDDDDDLDLAELVSKQVQEALAPVMQQLQSQQQEQLVSSESQAVEQELNELLEAQGLQLEDDDRQAIFALAAQVPDEEIDTAVQKGLQAFLRIRGGAQRDLVQSKATQPSGAMEGSTPNTKPDEIKSFDAAKKAARERLTGVSP